jgi:hypothetical protein
VMRGFFAIRRGPSGARRRLRLAWAGISLAIWATLAHPTISAERATSSRQAASSPKSHAASRVIMPDVALQPGGVLQGVVSSGTSTAGPERAVAGVRVALVREGKTVAETTSDRFGRFAVSHLRGGKYAVVTTGKNGVEWSLHRVWTPNAAPPKASAVARVVLGRGLVRGQGPLPSLSFPEAALMGGVVVGAVAAPIIYHNAQQSNRVPASP